MYKGQEIVSWTLASRKMITRKMVYRQFLKIMVKTNIKFEANWRSHGKLCVVDLSPYERCSKWEMNLSKFGLFGDHLKKHPELFRIFGWVRPPYFLISANKSSSFFTWICQDLPQVCQRFRRGRGLNLPEHAECHFVKSYLGLIGWPQLCFYLICLQYTWYCQRSGVSDPVSIKRR